MNKLIYEEERLLLHCQEALADAIERSGYTRSQIAKRLGKNRSFVTQALSGGRNLTLSTLAALLWAAGYRLEPTLASLDEARAMTPGEVQHFRLLTAANDQYYQSNSQEPNAESPEQDDSAFGKAA